MKNDLNQKDKESSRLIARIGSKYSEYVEKSSFADPEILSIGKDEILSYCKEFAPAFYHTMENLFRRNEHILDSKSEGILASFSDASSTFNQLYSKLTIVDNKGVKVLLSSGEEEEINKSNMTYYLSICKSQ
jgi:oligoendopeptidase F